MFIPNYCPCRCVYLFPSWCNFFVDAYFQVSEGLCEIGTLDQCVGTESFLESCLVATCILSCLDCVRSWNTMVDL